MIYLDNAATTKPDCECLKMAEKYLTEYFFNPSALYAEGYALHRELEQTRKNILNLVANDTNFEIIFTSCGSEADNHALFCGGKRGNIVTDLLNKGYDVKFAPLNSDGSVNVEELLKLIDGKTSLVSVIHVNNETGAINDVNAIAKRVKAINPNALFHSDGVQAFGKIPFKISKDIDLYSVSAHKIGALKGCGALIKRKSLVLKPFIFGGGQEKGLRSGTENVFGIKVFEFAALKKYENIAENFEKVKNLKEKLINLLDKELFKIVSSQNSSPYILSVIALGVRGEIILHEVNDKGLIIGTGSACSSNEKKRYSRVILSCGIDESLADGVLRLSFCPETSEQEIEQAAQILNETVKNRMEIMK